jgi:hypothetical protein
MLLLIYVRRLLKRNKLKPVHGTNKGVIPNAIYGLIYASTQVFSRVFITDGFLFFMLSVEEISSF